MAPAPSSFAAGDVAPSLADALDSPTAWAMAAVSFVALFVVYGVAYSFGAFFKSMAAEFHAGPGATSAVFSITAAVWAGLGWPAGYLADRYGARPIVVTGAIALGGGLIATSAITQLWVSYITYGLGVGIGIACVYVPTIALVGGWFRARRNTALGIAVSGIGSGTLVVSPVSAALIDHFGWRGTDVILGVAGLVILIGCAIALRKPPVHAVHAEVNLREALLTPSFIVLYVSALASSLGLFVPFVFLPPFAHDHGASDVAAAALVGFIGAASVVGRLGLGSLGDRLDVIHLYQYCYLILALSFGIWLLATAYWMLVLFAFVMGVAYGGFVALSPAVLAYLFGVRRLGSLMGALYSSGAVGSLIGPPLAGVIIAKTGGYQWAIVFAMGTTFISFVTLLPLTRCSTEFAEA